jgi:predicted ribosome quality control (RQC) complex YloA/Tae2 family protein
MANEPTSKDRFTSVDLRAVAREARRLVGSRLDKVFDLGQEGLSLLFRGRSTGRLELRVVPGRYAAVVPAGQEHAEGLSPLARDLRRLATGATLNEVAEPAGERYLELVLTRASDDRPTRVGAELFGTGNVVVARDDKVVAVQHAKRWSRRDLRPGAPYTPPPARDDAFALSAADIEAELVRSRTDLASTLATRLALGGPLAEEVIARGGWDPTAPASPRGHDLAPGIHSLLRELLAELGESPRGFLIRRDGVLVDATPYPSRRWEDVPGVEVLPRPTFSEAAVEFFGELLRPVASPEEAARAAERAGLERLRDRQLTAVRELADAVAAQRADADAILANFADAEAALRAAADAEPPSRKVRVELGGRVIEMRAGKGAREAARALYEQGKRLSVKLDGARQALGATEARLAQEAARPAAAPAAASVRERRREVRWFEKFRWFVSSEGALVLGGRDASTNDLLVRRHLKDGDVYLHADLHGAASVVVKRPPAPATVTEVTLREAAQWAVAFSKAWRAGLASASAFWATPDQVSKAAVSGEFVPRGAFMVRGTKHFVQDVPLELALGKIRYEGEERWIVAPRAAIEARGAASVLLAPGDERERPAREVELARDLGLSRTVLQALLPAGGVSVRRP